MKKYYLAATSEEIFKGDELSVDYEKEFDGKKIGRTIVYKVTEDSIPYLLEQGIIEEEDEDDDELIDFDEEDFMLFKEAVAGDIEELNQRVTSLEEKIKKLEGKQNKPKKETKK